MKKYPSIQSPSGRLREAISYQGHSLIRWQVMVMEEVHFFWEMALAFLIITASNL